MNKEGILIVVSGFSGAGKGTIMKALLERYDNYALSISATTRNPRPGEEEGKAYFFKTTEEFEKMIAKDDLIEYAMYVGNYYGTPKAYVEEQLRAGKDVILEIEIQGALKVKEKFPNTLLLIHIFCLFNSALHTPIDDFLCLSPPSFQTLSEFFCARRCYEQ